MKTDHELVAITREIKGGPPMEAVVLRKQSSIDGPLFTLLIRQQGDSSLKALCAWQFSSEDSLHVLYDQVFELMFECCTRLLGNQGVLF